VVTFQLEACSGAGDTGSPRGIRGDGYEAHGVTAVSGTVLHRATAGSGARREVMLCDDNHSTSGTMVCVCKVLRPSHVAYLCNALALAADPTVRH